MRFQIDLTREYGVVLEGGGAKGSYQIGAWKALREAGIRIKGIAGASVGALNGAMLCMDDLEKAEYIWENISYSKVMDVDDDIIGSVRKLDLKAVNLRQAAEDAKRVLKEKGFDITPLKQLIESVVDEECIRTSDRELFITTYSITDRRLLTLNARDIPEGEIGDMLLASAYFPVFKNQKLNGKRYIDGGGWNNVPVNVLLEQGYEDILIIRIYGLGFDSERVTEIPEGTNVYHIAPRQDLGGILEFDKKKARKNMMLGYYDAKRLLYGLSGRWYYIDAPYSESYYFERMMAEVKELLSFWAETEEGWDREELEGYRIYTEKIFPFMAKKMNLRENWDYKDLYLSMLETLARKKRINRFHIYTVDQLKDLIVRRYQTNSENRGGMHP
ncbi:MAG: patatin-like phospholipase family protein [Hungatella sp.]|nr:patatin-like phospholipase family protein [Hungatella sp.]